MKPVRPYSEVRVWLRELCREKLLVVLWYRKRSFFHAAVRFVTGGKYGHASVLVPEILPNGMTADSLMHVQAKAAGVEKSRVSHELEHADYAIVYSTDKPGYINETYDQLIKLVDHKYDWGQIASIAAMQLGVLIFGHNRVWDWFVGSRWFKRPADGDYICSEIASMALRIYAGPCKDENGEYFSAQPSGFIDPNQLQAVFGLEEVVRFK